MQTPLPQSEEQKSKDTSAPGREEEVIVNTEVQKQATNIPDETKEIEKFLPSDQDIAGAKDDEKERTFKEGLANNSDTEATE